MAVCIWDGLHFSTTTVSTYHKIISKNRIESYGHPNLRRHSISTFKLHDILWGSIGYPRPNFQLSEFARVFLVDFRVSQQVSDLTRRSGGNVMAVCICDCLHFITTTVSIYHKNLIDNRVKSYNRPNLLRHSISTFELHDILWASIGHLSQNVCLSKFTRVFLVDFFVSPQVSGLMR